MRHKVAEAMNLSIEELRGKEIKTVMLNTFQEFLLNKEKHGETEELKSESKKSKLNKKDDAVDSENLNSSRKQIKIKSPIKAKNSANKAIKCNGQDDLSVTDSSSVLHKSKASVSSKSRQIEKLKSYVFKCGVRKNWYMH